MVVEEMKNKIRICVRYTGKVINTLIDKERKENILYKYIDNVINKPRYIYGSDDDILKISSAFILYDEFLDSLHYDSVEIILVGRSYDMVYKDSEIFYKECLDGNIEDRKIKILPSLGDAYREIVRFIEEDNENFIYVILSYKKEQKKYNVMKTQNLIFKNPYDIITNYIVAKSIYIPDEIWSILIEREADRKRY